MTVDPSRLVGLQQLIDGALDNGEVGLQITVMRGDEVVVDVSAGTTGDPEGSPVTPSTVFPVFALAKGVTAVAAHVQIERGLLDPDAPIASYWPEYGANGKGDITLAHVLSHRAGVASMPADVTPERMIDWEWMVDRLAAATPAFAAGTANSYLAMTYGWLVGEAVRRTDPQHRDFGRFVAEEVAAPLGMSSFWCGVPADQLRRVATLSMTGSPPVNAPGSPAALAQPPQLDLVPALFNRRDVLQACLPAFGGVSDAGSVARFFAMLANGGELHGVRILSEARVRSFLRPRDSTGAVDLTYGAPLPLGMGGLWLSYPPLVPPGKGAVLCHPSVGGGFAWADLDHGISGALCKNRMNFIPPNPFAALPALVDDILGVHSVDRLHERER